MDALTRPGAPVTADRRSRLIAIVEVVLCSSVPTQFAIIALLHAAGWAPTDAAGHPVMTFVVIQLLADTLLVFVLMIAFLRSHGESATQLWISHQPISREMVVGLLTVPAIFLAVGIMLNTIRLFAPGLHNVTTNPLERMATSPSQAPLFAFLAILSGGVKEELQRAFMLRRFERYLGGATAGVIVISTAFGLAHVIQGWDAVITTATLGAFWAWMYLRRRSSIAPMVSHAGFNSLEILRVALVGQ